MTKIKMIQRLTAVILAMLVLFSVFPASAMAAEVPASEPAPEEDYLTGVHTFTGYSPIDPKLGISLFADTGTLDWYGMYQILTRNDRINYFTYTAADGTELTANLRTITRMYMDGVVAYCIRPGWTANDGASYTEDQQIVEWQTFLNENQRNAIALVVALGWPMQEFEDGADNGIYASYGDSKSQWQTSERYAATQILIWEFLMGWRSPVYPYTLDTSKTSSDGRTLLDTFYNASDNYAKWPTLIKVYNEILADMKNAGVYPSFAEKSAADCDPIMLEYNAATGKYEASVTDSNKVLSDYNFTTSASGVTLTRDGNTLKISATAAAASAMSQTPVTASATGTALSIDPDEVVTVWYAPSGSQEVITPSAQPDPLKVYIKLQAEVNGDLEIVKTSSSGNVSGFQFRVQGTGIDKTVTSDSTGKIKVENLQEGTYTVTEILTNDSAYYCTSTNPQTVKVEAGKTSTVTFNNEKKQWRVTVTKKDADTGTAQADATLDGAVYGLYKDGTLVKQYTVKNGTFTTDSYACGTGYTLKEISAPPGYQLDTTVYKLDDYSSAGKCSGSLTTSQVTVLEDVITGNFEITKRTLNPVSGATAPESGAVFRYWLKSAGSYDACHSDLKGTMTTGTDGKATSKELPYGTYVVEQTSGVSGTDMVSSFEVDITENGKTYEYTKDNPYWTGTVSIVKYEEGTTTPLIAKFNLLDKDKKVLETNSAGTDGKLAFTTKLVYGEVYYIQEVEAPAGFVLDKTLHEITVTDRDQEITKTLTNVPEEGSISVKKVDTTGTPMSGTTFRLDFSTDGQNWKPVTMRDAGTEVTLGGCTSEKLADGCLTTDATGVIVFTGLRVSGQTGKVYYRLIECSTKDGASMLMEPVFEGELPMDGSNDITVTAVNSDVFELPHTGSIGMITVPFGVMMLIFAGCTVFYFAHKYRKKED